MRDRRIWLPIVLALAVWSDPTRAADDGAVPTDAKGAPLNLDFEAGTLKDWHAEGAAFADGLVEGDAVARRRKDMKSDHAGRYWASSFERLGDEARGTLTSAPFRLTRPFASFLIGAGSFDTTRAEVVRLDDGRVIARASGDDTENLRRVAFDLTPHVGREVFIRLVDDDTRGWGHVNFDDFRLHDSKPVVSARANKRDDFLHAGLSPEEAAKAMSAPPGFKVTLFAGEPDVHQPIAFAVDDRGRLWVAEAYSYPIKLPADQARDQILIFEDTDGDGHFDSRKVFADKLNLVSGIELGFGGVYVGAAPQLLFLPDKDGDDRPDGPAEVLLDGWGYQDSHETLNTLTWGPDGWLYGCHGVFTHSKVGKPGSLDAERTPINAGIWRYHPTRRTFEVFAHGTSNPWGIAFDAKGQLFETACVIPHLYHVIPGARYERQAGSHFNPYTYDDIKTIADHRHYVGGNPHAGNGRSGDAGGGHAHSGAMIYQGGAWPKEYDGSLLMNNIHGARLNRDTLEPRGSGFVGRHNPDFLTTNDSWSQIINMKTGPDGQVYFIDWYDRQQCHDKNTKLHDRSNGRIFKLSYGDPKPVKVDLKALSSSGLLALMGHVNRWYVDHALRILAERGIDPESGSAAMHRATSAASAIERIQSLWAVQATTGVGPVEAETLLKDADPGVRSWAIRLLGDGRSSRPAAPVGDGKAPDQLLGLAASDPSPAVRLALASALQRMPLAERWPILEALVAHGEDASDHNLPLMEWYALEPLAAADPGRALKLAAGSKIPIHLPYTVRRVAAIGTPGALATLVEALGRADRSDTRKVMLAGIVEALKGRPAVERPAGWPEVFAALLKDADAGVRSQATALALTFGDTSAPAALRSVLADPGAGAGFRLEALAALVKARDAASVPTLQALVADAAVGRPAIRALAAFDDPGTPGVLLRAYPTLDPTGRRDALNTLAARGASALALLDAVEGKRVSRAELSADLVRQVRNLKDPAVDRKLAEVWGVARETSGDRARAIAEARAHFGSKPERGPDPMLGRSVFAKACQQCHVLFGTGGNVGPELTGSNRGDLDYVLANVYDPSALIGKDYQAHVVVTKDGRVLTGIVRSEDPDAITLVTTTEALVVPKGQVEERALSEASMMPEGLWANLSDHEVRSLLAYLASPGQVPALATPEAARAFFNGRDLAGWIGDPKLWSVEGGELVGKTSGLGHNEFLRSDLAAGDFRLTLKVKLVADAGNSGIQFRSEALPGGEVKGYQADVGPGWWGKLYEENGRGLLWDRSGESFIKAGEWNTYEVLAVGPTIRTLINGQPCVTLEDPKGARRGIVAFQLHSGGPTEVRYKDITLELDPTAEKP